MIPCCQELIRPLRQGESLGEGTSLPHHLWKRLDPLITRETTGLLWHSKATIDMMPLVELELRYIQEYISDPSNAWSISIDHLIPRDPTFMIMGDASHDAGGAFLSPSLCCLWLDVNWSTESCCRCKLSSKNPKYHPYKLPLVCSLDPTNSQQPLPAWKTRHPSLRKS
jgi:hypothetical protein